MLFRASLLAAVAAICVNQVVGAAVEGENGIATPVSHIATDSCLCYPST